MLDGNEEFPEPKEAAETVWRAVHDNKEIIDYPADSVCQKLYDEYNKMGKEEFKKYFYDRIFLEKINLSNN